MIDRLWLRSTSLARIASKSRELPGDMPEECGNTVQVTSPQPLWILHEPVHPLQTCSLNPAGTFVKPAGVEIEGGPNAN